MSRGMNKAMAPQCPQPRLQAQIILVDELVRALAEQVLTSSNILNLSTPGVEEVCIVPEYDQATLINSRLGMLDTPITILRACIDVMHSVVSELREI